MLRRATRIRSIMGVIKMEIISTSLITKEKKYSDEHLFIEIEAVASVKICNTCQELRSKYIKDIESDCSPGLIFSAKIFVLAELRSVLREIGFSEEEIKEKIVYPRGGQKY